MFGRNAPGFEELNADWGPASPFGPDDDPGTPMTHRDSSESDELDPDLFAPQDGKEPLDEPDPDRPVAPFVRSLYALLEGPYDETLCEWSENGRRIVFPDPTQFAETVCPGVFRHSKWTSFSRMLNMYDFRKVSSERGPDPAPTGLAPMVFEHDSFRRGGQGELYLVQHRRRKKPEDTQRDADREAEVESLRSRITELERQLSRMEMENAQLRSQVNNDYSLQLA